MFDIMAVSLQGYVEGYVSEHILSTQEQKRIRYFTMSKEPSNGGQLGLLT
jgi:hypothetical protein